MRRYEFRLSIPAEQTRRIYAGRAQFIQVEDARGLKLRLPAANFRAHVGADGIHGEFAVTVDDANRIVALVRRRPDPENR